MPFHTVTTFLLSMHTLLPLDPYIYISFQIIKMIKQGQEEGNNESHKCLIGDSSNPNNLHDLTVLVNYLGSQDYINYHMLHGKKKFLSYMVQKNFQFPRYWCFQKRIGMIVG